MKLFRAPLIPLNPSPTSQVFDFLGGGDERRTPWKQSGSPRLFHPSAARQMRRTCRSLPDASRGRLAGGSGLRRFRPLRSCLSPTRTPVRASASDCAPAHTQHTPAPVEPAHIEALQTAVARQGVDTLGSGCALLVDRLAGVRTHALSPGGDGTAVAGTGGMPITRGSLGFRHRRIHRGV